MGIAPDGSKGSRLSRGLATALLALLLGACNDESGGGDGESQSGEETAQPSEASAEASAGGEAGDEGTQQANDDQTENDADGGSRPSADSSDPAPDEDVEDEAPPDDAPGTPEQEAPHAPAEEDDSESGKATGENDEEDPPAEQPAVEEEEPEEDVDSSEDDHDPSVCQASTAEQQDLLALVNQARAEARACGTDNFEAAPPLSWSCRLESAARSHSEDMATVNFFSHTGSDGLQVKDRVNATGYSWGRVGENLAAGMSTAAAAVDGWLSSDGHCANIMNPDFSQMGLARASSSGSDFGTYWTQVLARPQ